jgi:integrase
LTLKVKDIHERRGVKHFHVHGKGGKIRYVPIYAGTLELINVPRSPKAPPIQRD